MSDGVCGFLLGLSTEDFTKSYEDWKKAGDQGETTRGTDIGRERAKLSKSVTLRRRYYHSDADAFPR